MNKNLWTKELKTFLHHLDHECYTLGIDGCVAIPYRDNNASMGLWDIISRGEELDLIRPGQTILDMGSGSGTSSIIWGHRGYIVIGIELYPELVRYSQQGIRKYKELFGKEGDIRIVEGSYYPESYIEKRKNGDSAAIQIENDILSDEYARETHQPRLHLVCETDIYKEYNIDIKEIDIFYAYKYKLQAPSILEMFRLYSSKDAILCIIGNVDDMVERFGLEKEFKHCFVGREIKKRIKKGVYGR